ncbi:MAG: DNA mismatch repair protein MutS [Gammaproteobacteria bacterium]|nr:DNA mismatch repair protein MutS [Gammaproteobacteria bacterium]
MSISDTDKKLFQRLCRDVKPLKATRRVHHKPARVPVPPTRQSSAFAEEISDSSINYPLSPTEWVGKEQRLTFTANGVQNRVMQRLRRGQYPITSTLDLHGHTIKEAAQLTEQFLRCAWRDHHYCLRIIHGKGLAHTNRHAVLKSQLNHWLKQHPLVLAFCSAPDNDGGGGALYLLICRQRSIPT